MGFKESYLVPKEDYLKLCKAREEKLSQEPADVLLKKHDLAKRLEIQTSQIPVSTKRDEEILNTLNDRSKRNLAASIIEFILRRGGGRIKWDDDYKMILDGEKYYHLDIREVIRQLVGELPDEEEQCTVVVSILKQLRIPQHLLDFYMGDKEYLNWSPIHSKSSDEEEELWYKKSSSPVRQGSPPVPGWFQDTSVKKDSTPLPGSFYARALNVPNWLHNLSSIKKEFPEVKKDASERQASAHSLGWLGDMPRVKNEDISMSESEDEEAKVPKPKKKKKKKRIVSKRLGTRSQVSRTRSGKLLMSEWESI